jgi:hypothetical protein
MYKSVHEINKSNETRMKRNPFRLNFQIEKKASNSTNLCEKCNLNQQRKLEKLASFEPTTEVCCLKNKTLKIHFTDKFLNLFFK